MNGLQRHFRIAQRHLNLGRTHLELALRLAKRRHPDPNWIAAINKALADNQKAYLHIGNMDTLVALPPDLPNP